MNPRIVLTGLAIVAMALTACGGGSAVVRTACTTIAAPPMLYPPPSATGVPDGNFDIWVGAPQDPSIAFSTPVLEATDAASVTGTPWLAPSPTPQMPPGLLPLPSGDTYWTSSILALSPSTTYTVTLTNSLCGQSYSLGSFTTQ